MIIEKMQKGTTAASITKSCGAHYGPEDILRLEYDRSVLYEEEVTDNE